MNKGAEIDWKAVRAELDSTEWEERLDGDGFERLCFLGSIFSLSPSGKFYAPFASSNVEPCEDCKGLGSIWVGKRRLENKARNRLKRDKRKVAKIRKARQGETVLLSQVSRRWERDAYHAHGRTCPKCAGVGSREAHLDEVWREKLEAEAGERGLYVTGGEGDPCDIFVGESCDEVTKEVANG